MDAARIDGAVLAWLREHRNAPILGGLSLFALLADMLISGIFLGANPGSGEQSFWYFTACLSYFCIACLVSMLLGIASLVRRERPRWLAIIGLCLTTLPALGGLYILAGAPL
jgi:hypothetical protein